jgi:hypothetical protein
LQIVAIMAPTAAKPKPAEMCLDLESDRNDARS